MKTLLEQRHPDIPLHVINTTKKYTNLDIEGNVIECLQRETLDEDFKDVTEIERERVKIANYEKELARMKRKAYENKEKEEDYEKTNNTTDRNN